MTQKPMPFWKIYLYKRELEKMTPHKIVYNRYNSRSYCIFPNKIVLPFVEPLDLTDLKVLLQHEEEHLKYGKLRVSTDHFDYVAALNLLEDWFVNEKLDKDAIAKIYRKLGSQPIGLIPHLPKETALRIIKELIEDGVLVDTDPEKILSVFNEALSRRKKYDRVQKFYDSEIEFLDEKYFPLFELEKLDAVGDGPCEPDDYYTLPDWDAKRQFSNIIKRFVTTTFESHQIEGFVGKRLYRKFLFDDTCIKPFTQRKDIITQSKPKVCVILDMSGSMSGDHESLGKALAMSVLECLPNSFCILHNEYYTKITTIPDAIVKAPATGDEWFHTLMKRTTKWKDCDVLIIVSDLIIDDYELKGLNTIIRETKARAKYCLCVEKKKYYEDNVECKKFLCTSKEGMIEAVKRISLQYG